MIGRNKDRRGRPRVSAPPPTSPRPPGGGPQKTFPAPAPTGVPTPGTPVSSPRPFDGPACLGTGRAWVPTKRKRLGHVGWGRCPLCGIGEWEIAIDDALNAADRPIDAPMTPNGGPVLAHPHRGPIIVVDTREQLPYPEWSLDQPYGFPWPTVRKKLDAGDYSLLGFETRVAIERKRPIELYSCFTTDRDRFRREFERLASYDYAALVIEGTMASCASYVDATGQAYEGMTHGRYTNVSPALVINSIVSWAIRYGVQPWFAGAGVSPDDDRSLALSLTFRLLEKFAAKVARDAERLNSPND